MRKNNGFLTYLEANGLKDLSKEELQAHRAAYKKLYDKRYSKAYRSRKVIVKVSFTSQEAKELRVRAALQKRRLASYVKRTALESISAPAPPMELRELLLEVSHIRTAIEKLVRDRRGSMFQGSRIATKALGQVERLEDALKEVLIKQTCS